MLAIHRLTVRRTWVSLTLDNRRPACRHFCIWMEHNNVLARSRHVRLTDNRWASGTKGYAPAPGQHWLLWRGTFCRLGRTISDKSKVGAAQDQQPTEVLTVPVPFGQVATILGWIDEGQRRAQRMDRIGPGVHILKGDYWEHVGDVPRRAIDTVLVDDDRVARVLDDMRWFYEARDWYPARGVPWRRRYLFHGPPGTGRSSLTRAFASALSVDIATLDVGHAGLTDDDLGEVMMCAPARCLIAVEDVDAMFTRRERGEKGTGVSFSGLLNAIDGVAAQEGRALVMTSNHEERRDPALIRPGRSDVHIAMELVRAHIARRLFERFFPGEDTLAARFEQHLGQAAFSPAQIQRWLLENSADPHAAAQADGLRASSPEIGAEYPRAVVNGAVWALLPPRLALFPTRLALMAAGSKDDFFD